MTSGDSTSAARPTSGSYHLPVLGEIHTGLLQNATALSPSEVRQLLALIPGHPVQSFERPVQYARSPKVLNGLDCDLMGASGARVHVVGTAASRATITGGHVLQASSSVRLQTNPNGRRRRWPAYLSQPGVVDVSGRAVIEDLELGFIRNARAAGVVDLGSISGALVDHIQTSNFPTILDRRPPIRIGRTQVRWTAHAGETVRIHFSLDSVSLRTIRLTVREEDMPMVAGFCEDVALHDWLLTGLLQIVDKTRAGVNDPRQITNRLRPVLDHLVHLWMPSARQTERIVSLWNSLDQYTGFSRQWETSASRVRDRFGAAAAALMNPVKNGV
jgi:hypothetical protein